MTLEVVISRAEDGHRRGMLAAHARQEVFVGRDLLADRQITKIASAKREAEKILRARSLKDGDRIVWTIPQDEMESEAKSFAIEAHKGQKYNGAPYETHLTDVRNVLVEFGFGWISTLLAGAWLHDVVEDTSATVEDLLSAGFSSRICALVEAVTDEPGKNRAERHAKTYPKIKASGPFAIILKLADRIANGRIATRTGNKLDMYRKEYPEFREALYVRLSQDSEAMWAELDKIFGPEKETK